MVEALEHVLVRVGMAEVEDVLVPDGKPGRPPALNSHSGWARARSDSRLTISGSTQSPNCIPSAMTWSISGSRPSGQTSVETDQSPRLVVSSRRPAEPAVVEHEPLDADLGGPVGQLP